MGNLATLEFLPYMRAPEICVEIRSPSNPETASGEQPNSGFPVEISLPPPIK